MAARFGNVLYWAGCGLAALCVIAAGFGLFNGAARDIPILAIIFAVMFWLGGRALRYILAGT